MEQTTEKSTQISVGASTHRDFFQRGREAAQIAKTQHPNSTPSLVLALSDAGVHFKDFIEGVRLVMGEERLIGLPTEPWLAQDAPSHETGAVIIITSRNNRFFVTPHRTAIDQTEVATTHLASAVHQHQSNGLLIFGEDQVIADRTFQRALACDSGPDVWAAGMSCGFTANKQIACQNQFLNHGIAAIGISSPNPWPLESVALGPFSRQPQFLEEGIKTALRSALQQKRATDVALALFFLNGFKDLASSDCHRALSQSMSLLCPHTPWLGLTTDAHFVHHNDRWHPAGAETLTTILVTS